MRLKDIEKEYKVKFDENPNMKLETWLKKKGLKPLANTLKKIKTLTKP